MTLADIQQAAGLKTPIRHQLFIDGRFVDAESGETLATLNPHDNSTIAEVAMAGKADIDRAVAAAQKAFPKWSRMAAADRGRILLKLADRIEQEAQNLARLESLDTGHPLRDSLNLDVPRTAKQQAKQGLAINKDTSRLLPGDLLTFGKTKKSSVSHIGIYIGDGRYIHASSIAGRVVESSIDRPYSPLIKIWRGARRMLSLDDSAAAVAPVPTKGGGGAN